MNVIDALTKIAEAERAVLVQKIDAELAFLGRIVTQEGTSTMERFDRVLCAGPELARLHEKLRIINDRIATLATIKGAL